MHRKRLKTSIPVLLGVLLIFLFYNATSVADRQQILNHLQTANYFWIFISVILGMLSHLSRAIRWKIMLKPMGYSINTSNSFLIILTAYLANLGIPRSGEFLRATALDTYENVPFQKGFGTIVTERIVDLFMLLIIIGIAFFLQTETLLSIINNKGFSATKILLFLGFGILGVLLFLFVVRKSSHPIALKLKSFAAGLLEGVFSVFRLPNKGIFIFHSVFIWSCYIGMFWILKYAFTETQTLGIGALLVAFVAGAFAMTATNGGLGLYPIAVAQILMLFNITSNVADAFGWLMWISQTLMVLIFGGIAFILLPLRNRASNA